MHVPKWKNTIYKDVRIDHCDKIDSSTKLDYNENSHKMSHEEIEDSETKFAIFQKPVPNLLSA